LSRRTCDRAATLGVSDCAVARKYVQIELSAAGSLEHLRVVRSYRGLQFHAHAFKEAMKPLEPNIKGRVIGGGRIDYNLRNGTGPLNLPALSLVQFSTACLIPASVSARSINLGVLQNVWTGCRVQRTVGQPDYAGSASAGCHVDGHWLLTLLNSRLFQSLVFNVDCGAEPIWKFCNVPSAWQHCLGHCNGSDRRGAACTRPSTRTCCCWLRSQ
jgi:hypothetical protein